MGMTTRSVVTSCPDVTTISSSAAGPRTDPEGTTSAALETPQASLTFSRPGDNWVRSTGTTKVTVVATVGVCAARAPGVNSAKPARTAGTIRNGILDLLGVETDSRPSREQQDSRSNDREAARRRERRQAYRARKGNRGHTGGRDRRQRDPAGRGDRRGARAGQGAIEHSDGTGSGNSRQRERSWRNGRECPHSTPRCEGDRSRRRHGRAARPVDPVEDNGSGGRRKELLDR